MSAPLARHGRQIIKFRTSSTTTRRRLIVLGPSKPEHGHAPDIHQGRFALPLSKNISGALSVSSPTVEFWLVTRAILTRWDGTIHTVLGESALMVPPVSVPIGDTWTRVHFFLDSASPMVNSATHWSLALDFINRTTPIPLLPSPPPVAANTTIYLDGLYVPDSGLDVGNQPYLDGDQPGAFWEGDDKFSTSTYGVKPKPPEPVGAGLFLEDDFVTDWTP